MDDKKDDECSSDSHESESRKSEDHPAVELLGLNLSSGRVESSKLPQQPEPPTQVHIEPPSQALPKRPSGSCRGNLIS